MEVSELASAGCNVPLTTFVQTDTTTFREVVQRLTAGSLPSDPEQVLQVKMTNTNTTTAGISNAVSSTRKAASSSTSKLHERRQCMKMRPKLEIVKPTPTTFHSKPSSTSSSPRPLVLSPCTIFSKLSILQQEQAEEENKLITSDQNNQHHQILLMDTQEEEKAIKGRRFYLHPSPRGASNSRPPALLTLFPLTSPKSSQIQ